MLYSTGETDMALEMRGAEAGNPFGGHGRPVFGRDSGDRLEVCLFLDLSRSRIHPLSLPHSNTHIHAHAHTHTYTHTYAHTRTLTQVIAKWLQQFRMRLKTASVRFLASQDASV